MKFTLIISALLMGALATPTIELAPRGMTAVWDETLAKRVDVPFGQELGRRECCGVCGKKETSCGFCSTMC
ncbi:hypothetical protein ACMFMG_012142 [Clarireedia jacksonii]